MLTLGVDPGLHGALQSIILEALHGRPCRAVVERVGSMPRQGIASAFTFGAALGSILATLQALHLPIELVAPGTWKAALGLGKDKAGSLHKARLLFPGVDLALVKHADRAEALLIAYYAQTRRREAA